MYFSCNSFAFMEMHCATIIVLLIWYRIQYLINIYFFVNIESFLFNAPLIDLDCYFICFQISCYLFHDFFLITITYKSYLFLIYHLIYLWTDIVGHTTLLCHSSELLSHFTGQLTSNPLCGHSVPSTPFLFGWSFVLIWIFVLWNIYSFCFQYFRVKICWG